MKFLRFRIKNLNVLLPSYLKATHRKPITADPRTATSAEVIIELGRGRNSSRTIPKSGAAMTIVVREYFPELPEEACPKESDNPESPHVWKESSSSKH
jgi:hypothetical protein